MGCPTTTVKILFIIYNVFIAIYGIAGIVGVALNPDEVVPGYPYTAYVACVILIIVAIVGIIAAIKESVCWTTVVAICLLIIAIIHLASTVIQYKESPKAEGSAILEKAWDNNDMDSIQEEHNCCGKTSAHDYVVMMRAIPASCYADKNLEAKSLFIDGCSIKLREIVERESTIYFILCWVWIGLEIFGFLLAVFLAISFRNKQRRMQF